MKKDIEALIVKYEERVNDIEKLLFGERETALGEVMVNTLVFERITLRGVLKDLYEIQLTSSGK